VVGVDVTSTEKAWNCFQAIGNIAFAYTYSSILVEIQVTQFIRYQQIQHTYTQEREVQETRKLTSFLLPRATLCMKQILHPKE
jgi:hypothetical protein